MKFPKILAAAAALTLWTLVYAHPAFAQFVSIPDASIGFAEGNQAGNVVLTLGGASEAVVQGLQINELTGRYEGTGRIDFDGSGISIHEPVAQFSVRLESFEPPAGCNTPIDHPAFAAHIEVRAPNGNLVCVAGNPVIDESHPCPQWKLSANVGANLPPTLALLKSRYRDGKSVPTNNLRSLGSVKGEYVRTVSGRYIKATL